MKFDSEIQCPCCGQRTTVEVQADLAHGVVDILMVSPRGDGVPADIKNLLDADQLVAIREDAVTHPLEVPASPSSSDG